MLELKNIQTLPVPVQERVEHYSRRMLDIHGVNIISIVVYGSASGANFVAGVSDVNMAVVFKALDFSVFEKNVALSKLGHKYKITAPLFLTKEYLQDSTDVFPLEFSEIKDRHVVIWGEDVFSSLMINEEHVRLFCETQIKGKLLRIRQSYLESGDHPRSIRHILIHSLNSLMPVFRQLIRLKGEVPSIDKIQVLEQLGRLFSLDVASLMAIFQDKNRTIPMAVAQIKPHLKNYLQQIEVLAHHVDRL